MPSLLSRPRKALGPTLQLVVLEDRTVPAQLLTIAPTTLTAALGGTPPPLTATGMSVTSSPFARGLGLSQDMAFDQSGNLYVADQSGGDVIMISPQGATSIFATGFNQPTGLAFDSHGNLFVSNEAGNSISKVTAAGVVTPFIYSDMVPTAAAAKPASGAVASMSQSLATTSPFFAAISQPGALAVDGNDNLYIANEGTGTISKVTPTGVATVIAKTGAGSLPSGLAFDRDGNLFISDQTNNSITEVNPAGGVIPFVSAGAGLVSPAGMAFDSNGNLYVVNYKGNTVSEISPKGAVTSVKTGALNGPVDVAVRRRQQSLHCQQP